MTHHPGVRKGSTIEMKGSTIDIEGLRASATAGAARIESTSIANEPTTGTRRWPAWPRGEARAGRCARRGGLFAALLAGIAVLCQAQAFAQTDVPVDWPLKPSGLVAGDEFRLLLMSKNPRLADSTNIAVYDSYVQGRISAIGHAEIKAYSSHFKVLGSTATVNARSHTGTTGTGGVPIYWLNGAKVADNYADFYDGSWTNRLSARLENGTVISQNRRDQPICTGTNDDGTTANNPLGVDPCTATTIDSANTLSGTTHSSTSSEQPRYLALSGVFRVAADAVLPTIPAVASVAITSDAGTDREYVKDDAVEVTVTFTEAVAVTGTPRFTLRLAQGQTGRANYVETDSTATELTFKYAVRAADYSYDGINYLKDVIGLHGGTITNQAGTQDAILTHPKAVSDSNHRVHIKPTVSDVTVASTPASGTSYATGETIEIDPTFNRKVKVFTDGGTPTLAVNIGSAARQATYTTTIGDDVVRFEYVVQAGDQDTDGILLGNSAITWNGGFIIRQEHGDVSDKAPLQVAADGGSTGTGVLSGHRVNAVDVLRVDISPTSLTVAEGRSDIYDVFLTAAPTGNVTVTASVTGSSDVTVNPTSLTFTTVNWNDIQEVTVSAAHDADTDADTATIEHTVSGANYGSVIADDVVVTVTEDDRVSTKVTLTVSVPTLAESAGATQVTVTGAFDETEPLLSELPFHTGHDLVQMIAHRFGIERGADRQDVLQQVHRGIERYQGSPLRLQIQHLRRDMRAEQFRQRAEGPGSGRTTPATLQARTCNRNVTEGRAEQERSLTLAPEPAGALRAAAVLHEGGGLRRHDPLLKLPEKGPWPRRARDQSVQTRRAACPAPAPPRHWHCPLRHRSAI